ncbi:hypothetical protein MALG_01640 [Marinovum algicola DG 898]|nr:hypothetical protein MALG_01640 [Marinovum algicola DG 898]
MTPCALLVLEARARRMAQLGVSITFAPGELMLLADWLAQQAPRAPP